MPFLLERARSPSPKVLGRAFLQRRGGGWLATVTRQIPGGYLETLQYGHNVMLDPDLAPYSNKLESLHRATFGVWRGQEIPARLVGWAGAQVEPFSLRRWSKMARLTECSGCSIGSASDVETARDRL